MVELAGGPRLLLEAAQAVGLTRHGGGEDLDGHVAPQAGVPGAIDLAHAARPEGGHNLVWPQPCARGQSHHAACMIGGL